METLDQDAVNLAKAIRQHESGGDFNIKGKSGETGAYQFTAPTWRGYAKEVLGDENAQMTPENQNKVAYTKIKKWKDEGKNVGQIASMWNAGEGRPDAYKENFRGVNEYGVSYDTPAYAQKVAEYYQHYKGASPKGETIQSSPQVKPDAKGYITTAAPLPEPTEPVPEKDKNLGQQLKSRVEQGSEAVSALIGGKKATGTTRASGLLRTAGAVAGGLGDVVGATLELVPGVKQLENLIGQGVGKLVQTSTGQAVAREIQKFSEKNPELAKDIGAGFNIVTAIPILRGIGVAGTVAKDASSSALKKVAEKSFTTGATGIIGGTKTGARFIAKNPNIAKEMLDRRLIGDIKGGKYTTADAVNQSWKAITDSNKKIEKILDKTYKNRTTIVGEDTAAVTNNVLKAFPNSKFASETVLNNGRKLTPQNGKLWDKFENGTASLKDVNKLRSDLDTAVKSVYSSISQPPIRKELGKALADSMRTFVKEQAPKTRALFDEMSSQFNIQKALGFMEGTSVKPGMVAGLIGHGTGIGVGGAIGGAIGGPTGAFLGGMVGDKAAGTIAKKVAQENITQGILKRTGKNATRTSKSKMLRGLIETGGGVAGNEANR